MSDNKDDNVVPFGQPVIGDPKTKEPQGPVNHVWLVQFCNKDREPIGDPIKVSGYFTILGGCMAICVGDMVPDIQIIAPPDSIQYIRNVG